MNVEFGLNVQIAFMEKPWSGVAVQQPGVYAHGEKWTLIVAIDCNRVLGFHLEKVAGTTVEIFDNFLRSKVIPSLVVGGPTRTFMWDNLGAHLSAVVYNTIMFAGHRVIQRPPYRPVDGPIEYIFNQLQNGLKSMMHEISSDSDFRSAVQTILSNVSVLDQTFVHCGYH
uniref:Integrase catalytic domain-containing protein n=1 Tax=Octactis speculum TaxID=3111310 RepID=A0A7S2GES8_9STRA|mmetsp:Transcript_46428/g.63236  ORF Transcript_46428/g.63236 Transcript_46428/m.63236 type:complete len:169 (+) Transcript_46428:404-910(+)